MGVGTLASSFPRLFRLVGSRWVLVKDYYVGEGGFGSWNILLEGPCVNLRSRGMS